MASTLKVDTITTPDGTGNITTERPLAGSGAGLTSLPAANLTGTLPAISGANLTTLPAANISGVIPAANLGTGTASASTFLNGSGAYAAVGGTKEFYIPFLFNSSSTSTNVYQGTNATNLEQAYLSAENKFLVGNFYVPNDFTSTTNFVLVHTDGAVTFDFDITTTIVASGESHSSVTDSVTVTGSLTSGILTETDISAALTGIAAGDYIGCKVSQGKSGDGRALGIRFKYS